MLAKSIARQSLEDDENEAIDGSPKPLRKNHASRLEAKLQGFRSAFLMLLSISNFSGYSNWPRKLLNLIWYSTICD